MTFIVSVVNESAFSVKEGESSTLLLRFRNGLQGTYRYDFFFSSDGGTASSDDFPASVGSSAFSGASNREIIQDEEIVFSPRLDLDEEETESLFLTVNLTQGAIFDDGSATKVFEYFILNSDAPIVPTEPTPPVEPELPTITADDDVLNGSQDSEEIAAMAGNDTVRGLGGNDTLLGQAGDDVLRGGGGDDNLKGGAGADSIFGQSGDDTLIGGGGDDLMKGGGGADRLIGGGGVDTLHGQKGDDTLKGGAGNDLFLFKPGDGDDVIQGFQQGRDTIEFQRGVSGFDALTIEQQVADVLVSYTRGSILFTNQNAGAFDADDFIF